MMMELESANATTKQKASLPLHAVIINIINVEYSKPT